MPLREVQFPCDSASLRSEGERFLIFFSSKENNALWCPDCRKLEGLVKNTFSPEGSPSAVLAYVGQKLEWKSPEHVFRKDPWKVTAIPTVIKLNEAGDEIGRLVDGENSISSELSSFIQ